MQESLSFSLAVDPASPDAKVEDRFFQQGVAQETLPHEELPSSFSYFSSFDDYQSRQRRNKVWIGGGVGAACLLAVMIMRNTGPGPAAASGATAPVASLPSLVTTAPEPPPALTTSEPTPPAVEPPAAPSDRVAVTPPPAPSAPVAEAQPAQVKEEPAEEGAEENPQPAAASPFRSPLAGALEDACRSAFEQKHYRDALNSCTRAFAARPEAAELAVLVARMELDRGRISDARTWAQKATDVDPNLAEAYVFLGTAEQQAGHAPAARVAYMRYLELAPHGRHAQDLRAILSDL